jgi:hypothetical protein
MGLFDSYFDPEQFQASGGLLGRLLSLQPQQGQVQPGADLEQTPAAPQAPVLQPMLWSNLPGYGPSSGEQTAAPELHSQYQALRPILGDHNAMLATVNPDIGKTLIAQTLANRQSDNSANVVSAGYRLGGIRNPPMVPVPLPAITVPAIPDWWKAAGTMLQLYRGIISDALTGGDKNPCLDRWEGEYNRCDMFRLPSSNRYRDACRARANDRLKRCYRNGGTPDPDEPEEYGWNDIPRDPAGR